MGISSYSSTPASNTSISGINIGEGCAPSGINDAIRQMMADIASGVTVQQAPTATGTANAIVVALSPAVTSYSTGQRLQFLPIASNTAAATINYGGGVINLQKRGGLALAPNDVLNGVVADVIYDGTRAILLNPQTYTRGADIASAATLNLDNATGDYIAVTGTTGITAITLADGRQVATRFTGALTITNGASLIAPGGANYTTVAGDVIVWRGEASGVVRAVGGIRADGGVFGGTININTGTTGTLNVDRGGTGAATLAANNVLLGNGTSALQVVAPGTSGNVLTSNGTTWQSTAPSGGASDDQTFTSSGTWSKPSGYPTTARVLLQAWGGGGGGADTAVASGSPGGTTTIGTLVTARGGFGGNITGDGGAGGGYATASSGAAKTNDTGFEGTGGGVSTGNAVGGYFTGGGGGGTVTLGGHSVYGGGGGTGGGGGSAIGTSQYAGNGGAAGTAGTAPAGGGGGRGGGNGAGGGGGSYKYRWVALSALGATETITIGAGGAAGSGSAGAGARGEVRITVFG